MPEFSHGLAGGDEALAQETVGLDAAPKWRPELAPSVAISTGSGLTPACAGAGS